MILRDPDIHSAPLRPPLDIGMAVAGRFMSIDPPPSTYMYHLGITGLLDLYEAGGDARLLDFVLAFHERRSGAGGFDWRLYRATGDARWLDGAREAGEAFLANPRRDREGALLDPRGRYTVDIVSGLATVPVIYGHLLHDHRYFDEAYRQLQLAREYLEDPATGLWYSRWGHGLHPHRPNPGLWGRGNGWLVNAWGRVMHLWDPGHARYGEVLELWQRYCRAQIEFQTPSGLFRQLMNRPESFEEATASGLIGAGIGYGVLHGSLPPTLGAAAFRAFVGLSRLVDDEGNIHNVSTTAGGYNFEQQYASCAIFNDAHGDGSVMAACAAAHRLLAEVPGFDREPPAVMPVIVTRKVPGCVSFWTHDMTDTSDIARPVLDRLLALPARPALDRQGGTLLGLLHWHRHTGEPAVLEKAWQWYQNGRDSLHAPARWRIAAEFARGDAPRQADDWVAGMEACVRALPRDREGLVLDGEGGYAIETLYQLLPLLGRAGVATGDFRYLDDACVQALGYREWLEDPLTGMWRSAYGRGAHRHRVTPGFWALGNACVIAGVVDLLDDLPREHPHYVDVVCLLRDLVKPMHAWLPIWGGWTQLFDDLHSFRCVAANGLLTYGIGKAVLRGWVKSAYHAASLGGIYFLGKLVHPDAAYNLASLPDGGLDTVEAYAGHRVENDPYALGFVLSACVVMKDCHAAGIDYGSEDARLGAR